jgi:hypothetical protein
VARSQHLQINMSHFGMLCLQILLYAIHFNA